VVYLVHWSQHVSIGLYKMVFVRENIGKIWGQRRGCQ